MRALAAMRPMNSVLARGIVGRCALVVDDQVVGAGCRRPSCTGRVVRTSGVLNSMLAELAGPLGGERDFQRHVAGRNHEHAAGLGIVERGVAEIVLCECVALRRRIEFVLQLRGQLAGRRIGQRKRDAARFAGRHLDFLGVEEAAVELQLDDDLLRLVGEIRHLHERLPLFGLGVAAARAERRDREVLGFERADRHVVRASRLPSEKPFTSSKRPSLKM